MHTKHQIQELLSLAGVKPNKRLGQHFLIDLNLMRKLIESAEIGAEDVVLEVGCGTGSLTEALSECAGLVIGVEVDAVLADIATGELRKANNVTILNTDILDNKHNLNKEILEAIRSARRRFDGRFLLVSNLPYHAASPLMFNLCLGPVVVDGMYVTVQKEVAKRMTAGPGSKEYGPLSIVMAATGSVEFLKVLKTSVFWPAPKVESAFVKFSRESEKAGRIKDIKLFEELLHLFMQHRRKIVNSSAKFATGRLAQIDNWPRLFEKNGINPNNRPEQLNVSDYVELSNLCYQILH
ncbi:MAG: 16S rRNA (adenine(1518)-N(6)/adenine(1519)-N(6))-dimethyltransferase RsmA [Planctomycetota bacterium]|jgi:16S rRNA (adenine1518-N6/adenine1519-N6)-dimethyltransferase